MTMIHVELDLGEAKALADVLSEYLPELRMEVFLKDILARLGRPVAA